MVYEWRDLSGGGTLESSTTSLDVSNLSSTTVYELLVIDTSEPTRCSTRDTIVVTFHPNPVADIKYLGSSRPLIEVCDSLGSVTLSALAPSHDVNTSYVWNNLTTSTSGIGTSSSLTVSGLSATNDYELIVRQDYAGLLCENRDTIKVTFNPNPSADIRHLGVSSSMLRFCDSEGAKTLTVNTTGHVAGTTYNWNVLSGGTSTPAGTGTSLTANVLSATTVYELIVTSGTAPTACQKRDTISVTFNPNPVADIKYLGVSQSLIEVCDSLGSLTLSALAPSHNAGTSYVWNNLSTSTSGIGTASSLTVGSLSATTTYEVVVTQNYAGLLCERRDTIRVRFNPNPLADIRHLGSSASSLLFCNSDGAKTLTANTTGHSAGTTYNWNILSGGTSTPAGTGTSLTANVFSALTVYELIVTSGTLPTACQRRDTISVRFRPNPTAIITQAGVSQSAVSFCNSAGAQTISGLHASHGLSTSYEWRNLSAGGTVVGTASTLTVNLFSASTQYQLTVFQDYGDIICQRRDTIMVNFNTNPVATIKHLGISKDTVRLC
ncbi:MAG: hypothetical protein EAZ67_00785, partial [Cytophagales bacterium]